jgi:acyl-CoA thioesterase
LKFTPEIFNQLAKERFPGLVGIHFEKIEPGETQCYLDVHEGLHHPGGVLHGGVAYTMADSAMAIALLASLEEGHDCATIEMKMTYLKAVREGRLTCNAHIVKKGRSIAMLEAEVKNDKGEPIARASSSFYIIKLGD